MAATIYDFEAINVPPRSAKIIMPTIKSQTRSTYAGAKQQILWNDGPLTLSMTFPPMVRETAERLIAFKASLDLFNGETAFVAGIPTQKTLMGSAVDPITVAVAGDAGSQNLQLKGFTAQATGVFKAGDWIQLGTAATTRIYKVLFDVDADLLGNATLQIRPGLRLPAAIDDPVTLAPARGLWELQPSSVEWDIDVIGHGRMTVEAIEALNVTV